MKNNINLLIHAIILIIGLYMIGTNWGALTPPVLSGIAFTLIGAKGFDCNKDCKV